MKEASIPTFVSVLVIGLIISETVLGQEYPGVEALRSFVNGDDSLWPQFEACAETEASRAIAAGHVALDDDQLDRAKGLFLKGLSHGHSSAVYGLILVHLKTDEPTKVYGWSQLVLHEHMHAQQNTLEDHKMSWPFRQMAMAGIDFSDSEWAEADRLAQSFIQEWLPLLIERPIQPNCAELLIQATRTQPNYPRNAAINCEPGWVHIDFEIDADGRVANQVALLYTDSAYARAGTAAVQDWRFPAPSDHSCKKYTQVLVFEMSIP
ncbi:MAG: energy transducer TonB [Pseudomonadota bacterium]